jgi:lysozyme family protein
MGDIKKKKYQECLRSLKGKMINHFDIALSWTMQHEGYEILTHNKIDPGGKTYSGISKVYWPDWEGWGFIDSGERPPVELIESFYRTNFWNRIQGDTLAEICPDVAYEVFDTSVNCGISVAVRFLQTAYNVSRGKYGDDLLVDGKLGPKTLDAVRQYMSFNSGNRELNKEILINCLNGEQYIFYKENPLHNVFRGWFTRL